MVMVLLELSIEIVSEVPVVEVLGVLPFLGLFGVTGAPSVETESSSRGIPVILEICLGRRSSSFFLQD